MNPVLGIVIYIVIWWLAFFVMLPMGAKSLHEAGEAVESGMERGAPKAPRLWRKALWAGAIAAVVWLGVAWAIVTDAFDMVP